MGMACPLSNLGAFCDITSTCPSLTLHQFQPDQLHQTNKLIVHVAVKPVSRAFSHSRVADGRSVILYSDVVELDMKQPVR